jgi:EmrB/QacA subfamily drug resistance transporter
MATFMATLDGSIVNIAMPVISQSFAVSIDSVQWIFSAYLIAVSATLLVWGKLSDLHGRKELFAAGMAIFSLGSLLCGLAGSLPALIAARVVQAIGSSIMMALTQGIVTSIFPPAQRGKALGTLGAVVSIGSLVGPALGGIMVHAFGWQSIFLVNIPIGIAGVAITMRIMPGATEEDKARARLAGKFDLPGSVLFGAAIILLFFALLASQDGMIAGALMVAMLALAAILLAAFFANERGRTNPLLDLGMFANPVFSSGLAASLLAYASMFVYIFFMPFYLQYVVGMDVLKSGLVMSAYPLTTALVAPLSGKLSDRIGYRPLTITGATMTAIVLALVSGLGAGSSEATMVILIVLLGAGGALFQSPNTSSVMGSAPREKLGIAGGISAFFRNFGMVSGTTFSVLLFSAVTRAGIDVESLSFDSVTFLKGFRAVMLAAAALSLANAALSAARRRKGRRPTGRSAGAQPI